MSRRCPGDGDRVPVTPAPPEPGTPVAKALRATPGVAVEIFRRVDRLYDVVINNDEREPRAAVRALVITWHAVAVVEGVE